MPKKPSHAVARPMSDAEVDRVLDDLELAFVAGALDPKNIQSKSVERLMNDAERTAGLMVKRVIEGRSRIPDFLVGMIAVLGLPGPLQQLVDAASVPPRLRLEANRVVLGPHRGTKKKRLAFLDSLPNADLELAEYLAHVDTPPVWNGDILEDGLAYLNALPSARRAQVLNLAAADIDGNAAPILAAALHMKDRATVLAAINGLDRLQQRWTRGPLGRLARTGKRAIRATAESSARHVTEGKAPAPLPQPLPPVKNVWATTIDASGGQGLFITRDLGDGTVVFANVLLNGDDGIMEVYGSMQLPAEALEMFPIQVLSQGLTLVPVSLEYVRGVLAYTLSLHEVWGRSIPPAYEIWQPWIHDTWPPPEQEPAVPIIIDDSSFAGDKKLVRRSRSLAEHHAFQSWAFAPESLAHAFVHAPPPRHQPATPEDFAPVFAILLDEGERLWWRTLLCRQAVLLDMLNDASARDMALAVSAAIGSATPVELARIPFLQVMRDRGVILMNDAPPLGPDGRPTIELRLT